MSISEREQQALASIEGDLVASGAELAAKLAMFTRLTAGEEMPPRERVWRAVRVPTVPSATAAQVSSDPERPRILHMLSRRVAFRVLLLVLVIASLALAVTLSRGGRRVMCTVSSTAACQHAPAPAPGRSGVGAAGGP
jgi:hypothetical protein